MLFVEIIALIRICMVFVQFSFEVTLINMNYRDFSHETES
jgi:hypothetical protein